MINKVLYFTNIFPLYRKNLFLKLLDSKEFDFRIFYDPKSLEGIKSVEYFDKRHKSKIGYLKNFALNRVILWQNGVIFKCIFNKYNKVLFLGEANILSTWIAALICRLRNKEVVFWTHGLYGNESIFKNLFRRIFYSLADTFLIYEDRGRTLMVNYGFDPKNIHVIYNSLDFENQLKLFHEYEKGKIKKNWNFFNNNFPTIIFIGRLTPSKKVDILIKAIENLNFREHNYNLLIVGKGIEEVYLKKLALNLINRRECFFVGEEYKEEQVSNYIYYSDICVSPGNIGLSSINALSYGTPVGTHNNKKNQMPEAEIVKNKVNGFYFEENNFESLANEISNWFDNNKNINKKKLREVIDLYYNPNFQIEVFKKIFIS